MVRPDDPVVTFHRRPLPDDLVAFESEQGRTLLAEAIAAGTAGAFFPLIAQLHTQADPAWCGLGSLVTTLNALGIDPGRPWKGPWRHFTEDLLVCCKTLEQAAATGLSLPEIACLATCNGAEVRGVSADPGTEEALRADLRASARAPAGPFVIANYDRSGLGQTGAGHYSPVGALHEGLDLALILDVARFKYPPHWVPVGRLWQAMATTDAATGQRRGWLVLSRGGDGPRPVCPPG